MAINPEPLTPKTKSKVSSLVVMASIAVLLGLVAASGIWQYLTHTQETVKKLTATRPVVVASKDIPAGTKLTEEFLTLKQLPAQTIPKDYPSTIESVKGRFVKNIIKPEEIITETRLVGQGGAGGLPFVIPPGHRALTMKVNEVTGVGGFVKPGDYIDLVSVVTKNDQQTFSKTILQNVLVLAVGDEILDKSSVSDPKAKIVGQITLALTPLDSEKLALAGEIGQLHLALKPAGDQKSVFAVGVKLDDIYGDLAYVPEKDLNQPGSVISGDIDKQKPKNSIEIVLGDQRSYFYY